MSVRSTAWEPGTPCWADLTTSDTAAARAFYAAVLGWQVQDLGPEFGHYALCSRDGHVTAGLGPATSPDQPTAWTTYLATEDVDKTTELVTANGGTVLMPPTDVAEQGRTAIAVDPVGATFGLWQAGRRIGAELVNAPGGLAWNDHQSRHPDEARAFYAAVLGYTYTALDGPLDYATIDGAGPGGTVGGIGAADPDQPAAPRWNVYFAVDDADVSIDAAIARGGQLVDGPTDTPFGRMATLQDAQGATFAVMGILADGGQQAIDDGTQEEQR